MMWLQLNVSHHLLIFVETQGTHLGIKRHPYDISGLVLVVLCPLFLFHGIITFKVYSSFISMVSKGTLFPTNTLFQIAIGSSDTHSDLMVPSGINYEYLKEKV